MALAPDSDLWNYFTNFKDEGFAECKLCKQRLKNNRSYNLRLHINKIHKNRTEIDKYFQIKATHNIAVCRTCNKQLQNRLCNIRMHMRKFHNVEIVLPEDRLFENSPSSLPYSEDGIQAVLKVAKRKMAEEVGNTQKRSTHRLLIRTDKNTIIRSVIGLVVEDGISPHLFNSKNFDAILRPMCKSIFNMQGKEFNINKAEIEKITNSMANYIRDSFSNDLSCRLLAIKIDNVLGDLQNLFCISARFIEGGEIQNRYLGLVDLKDNRELQEDDIKQILHKFNIDSNQIIGVFWDNTKSKYKNQVQNSEYLTEIDIFKSYPELQFGDVQIEPYLGSLAQSCLLSIFKNLKILQPFLECRKLVSFINDNRNGYFELFDTNKTHMPSVDSPWNAGSTCKMMNTLLENRSLLQTVEFQQPQEAADQFNCNEDLWLFIEAFCKSTNYLQKTILKYYNEEMHIGDFYAQWLKCKLLTEKFSEANKNVNDFFSTILSEILKSIEYTTNQLLQNERVAACLYLDPRFQRILNADQKGIAVEYLQKLWYRSKLYIDDDIVLKPEAAQLLEDDEDAFLNEFLSHDLHVNDKTSPDVVHKIEALTLTFQTADTNILLFWRGLKSSDPEAYTLSLICFAIPGTEIYTKTRCHINRENTGSEMSEFTKENLLFLRLNAHLLDDSLTHSQLMEDKKLYNSSNSSGNEADSCEESEDENSCTASTSTNISSIVGQLSNVDVNQSLIEVKVENSI